MVKKVLYTLTQQEKTTTKHTGDQKKGPETQKYTVLIYFYFIIKTLCVLYRKKIVTILLLCSDCEKDAHAEISCWLVSLLFFLFLLPFFNFNPACEFFLFFAVPKEDDSNDKSSAAHSCRCGQYFPVSRQWYKCRSSGFLMCAHTVMHVWDV